jgi:hypothetical protein
MLAHGGLRDAERVGSARKAPQFCGKYERVQMAHFHVQNDSRRPAPCHGRPHLVPECLNAAVITSHSRHCWPTCYKPGLSIGTQRISGPIYLHQRLPLGFTQGIFRSDLR